VFGAWVEGANVSAYVLGDEIRLLEFTGYGEMGRVEYSVYGMNVHIRMTQYNMQI